MKVNFSVTARSGKSRLRMGFEPENDNDELLLDLLIDSKYLHKSETQDDDEIACCLSDNERKNPDA